MRIFGPRCLRVLPYMRFSKVKPQGIPAVCGTKENSSIWDLSKIASQASKKIQSLRE